jgi:hypothetical protein
VEKLEIQSAAIVVGPKDDLAYNQGAYSIPPEQMNCGSPTTIGLFAHLARIFPVATTNDFWRLLTKPTKHQFAVGTLAQWPSWNNLLRTLRRKVFK